MSYKIEKQKNGKYKIRVWSLPDEFGKIQTKQVSNIHTVAVAKNLALEIEESFALKLEPPQDYTFSQMTNLYMKAKEKTMSPNTLIKKKCYRDFVLKKWGNVKCNKINTRNVQDWVNELEEKENHNKKGQCLKKSTIQEYVKVLNTVLNWAVSQDYLDYNKIKKLEYREDEEDFEPTILTANELAEILKAIKKDCYNIYIPCLISLLADPRRGESLAIQKDDIDFEKNIIYLKNSVYEENGKTVLKNRMKTKSSRRKLVMSEFLKKELQEHLEMNKALETNFVCDNIFIGEVTPSYITHKFHDFVKERFNIEMRFHDLRHNFNQLCFENGIDLSTRSKMMGHSSEKITNRIYTHFSYTKSQEAVESITSALGFNS